MPAEGSKIEISRAMDFDIKNNKLEPIRSTVKNIKIDDSLQPKAIIIINSENNMAEFFKIRDFLANQGFIVSFSKNKVILI